MAILADLFVASADDAANYESSLGDRDTHLKKFSPVEYTRLTNLEFGFLWAVIVLETWDVNIHMLEDVACAEGGETWLCRFPEPFLNALTSLESARIGEIADAWSLTEELAASGFRASDIKPIVDDLVHLANAAKSSGLGLYLWGSL